MQAAPHRVAPNFLGHVAAFSKTSIAITLQFMAQYHSHRQCHRLKTTSNRKQWKHTNTLCASFVLVDL